MNDEVKIYMELAGIIYKEKREFQVFLHIVETQDNDLLLMATIASNSFFAVAKAASKGVVQTTAPLSEIMSMLAEEESKIDVEEDMG
jgi:hypothetical protein